MLKKSDQKGNTSITRLVTNTSFKAKKNEVRNKIPSITNLASTSTALSTIKNKIPNDTNLVKK